MIQHHFGSLFALLLLANVASATPLQPVFDVTGPGLECAIGGVGLAGLDEETRTMLVDIDGTLQVESAYLYWAGVGNEPDPGSEDNPDQRLVFDGEAIVGELVGSDLVWRWNFWSVGYRADVTALVEQKIGGQSGSFLFAIRDGDPANDFADMPNYGQLSGAGLYVLLSDPQAPACERAIGFAGADFAHPGTESSTNPVLFGFDPESEDRAAELVLFVGDASDGRPDRIDISDNASLVDELTGRNGVGWDSLATPVALPADSVELEVALVSPPPSWDSDSLVWSLAVLKLPVGPCVVPPPAEGCTAKTQGFWGRQCSGDHPSGEPDMLPEYVDCLASTATLADVWDVVGLCGGLQTSGLSGDDGGGDPATKCAQAESQFTALMLNLCSGRLTEACCVASEHTSATTVAEAVTEVDGLLSNPDRSFADCVLAQAIADGLNQGVDLCAGDDDDDEGDDGSDEGFEEEDRWRATGPVRPGDCWGGPDGGPDGRLDVSDILFLLRASVGLQQLPPPGLLRADVAPTERLENVEVIRGNGRVDLNDILLLLRASTRLTELVWG